MNILTAVRNLSFVSKLFTAAKLDLNAMIEAGDETALAAHIEAGSKAAPVVAITGDHPEVAALISAALAPVSAQLASLQAQSSAFVSGVSAAGVKIEAAQADAPTAEEIAASINARAAIVAQEQLAKRGLASFPGSEPAADPTKPSAGAKPTLTFAEFSVLCPAEKMKFSISGGRLIS